MTEQVVATVGNHAAFQDAIAHHCAAVEERLLNETLAVCRIPAPTFAEAERAAYILQRLRAEGLSDADADVLSNVSAVLPGTGGGPTVMVVAHMDTVFPVGTDVEPRNHGAIWRAPGIRDNSASVAVLLLLPRILRSADVRLPGDLILAFSVGEEGLGNLRGMTALIDRYGSKVDAVVAADGNLGVVNHIGITVRRLQITATTQGGHSWADAGRTSAVHVLAHVAAEITRLPIPKSPRSALNIGTFHGGTSVNAIAEKAELALDIRSVDSTAVADLEERARKIVADAGGGGATLAVSIVGDRPGGSIPEDHPLVDAILAGYRQAGIPAQLLPGSTDANIPLSRGIPAASMGVSSGGNIHTLNEFLDPSTLSRGAEALISALILMQKGLRA